MGAHCTKLRPSHCIKVIKLPCHYTKRLIREKKGGILVTEMSMGKSRKVNTATAYFSSCIRDLRLVRVLSIIMHRCNSAWCDVCPTVCMIYLLNYTAGLDCWHGAPSLSFTFILHFRSTPCNLDINTMKQVFINKLVDTRLSNPPLFGGAARHCCLHKQPTIRHCSKPIPLT